MNNKKSSKCGLEVSASTVDALCEQMEDLIDVHEETLKKLQQTEQKVLLLSKMAAISTFSRPSMTIVFNATQLTEVTKQKPEIFQDQLWKECNTIMEN